MGCGGWKPLRSRGFLVTTFKCIVMKKREKERLTHRIHTRITRQKYEELSALLKRSGGQHSLSELLRNILDNRQIRVRTYDASLEKIMEELSAIRTQIHAIGININQVTRRFHTERQPESRILELTTLFQQSDQRITELFSVVAQLSERWLPRS